MTEVADSKGFGWVEAGAGVVLAGSAAVGAALLRRYSAPIAALSMAGASFGTLAALTAVEGEAGQKVTALCTTVLGAAVIGVNCVNALEGLKALRGGELAGFRTGALALFGAAAGGLPLGALALKHSYDIWARESKAIVLHNDLRLILRVGLTSDEVDLGRLDSVLRRRLGIGGLLEAGRDEEAERFSDENFRAFVEAAPDEVREIFGRLVEDSTRLPDARVAWVIRNSSEAEIPIGFVYHHLRRTERLGIIQGMLDGIAGVQRLEYAEVESLPQDVDDFLERAERGKDDDDLVAGLLREYEELKAKVMGVGELREGTYPKAKALWERLDHGGALGFIEAETEPASRTYEWLVAQEGSAEWPHVQPHPLLLKLQAIEPALRRQSAYDVLQGVVELEALAEALGVDATEEAVKMALREGGLTKAAHVEEFLEDNPAPAVLVERICEEVRGDGSDAFNTLFEPFNVGDYGEMLRVLGLDTLDYDLVLARLRDRGLYNARDVQEKVLKDQPENLEVGQRQVFYVEALRSYIPGREVEVTEGATAPVETKGGCCEGASEKLAAGAKMTYGVALQALFLVATGLVLAEMAKAHRAQVAIGAAISAGVTFQDHLVHKVAGEALRELGEGNATPERVERLVTGVNSSESLLGRGVRNLGEGRVFPRLMVQTLTLASAALLMRWGLVGAFIGGWAGGNLVGDLAMRGFSMAGGTRSRALEVADAFRNGEHPEGLFAVDAFELAQEGASQLGY